MDVPRVPEHDILAAPVRARLFAELSDLRRPAGTAELAQRIGRHPNSARAQLQRMADAGLLECRKVRQPRGRPRDAWAIRPGARPGGAAPAAHGDLSRWLARAMRGGGALAPVESAGREIGRELAPDTGGPRADDALQDALTALGFQPRAEPAADDGVRYMLGNCPYRDAVAENQPVVCALHRGITEGLLDRLEPGRPLRAFVARDPYEAGCLIEVGGRRAVSATRRA